MAHQIMEQPNGKFAIWSTIVDNFILLNATEEEIECCFASIAAEDSIRNTKYIFERHRVKSKKEIEGDWEYKIKYMEEMGHECKELNQVG